MKVDGACVETPTDAANAWGFSAVGAVLAVLSITPISGGAAAADGWFQTPAQRAAESLEAGEFDAVIEDAPDAYWEGIGRYGAGDAEGAADAFSRALVERAEADGAAEPTPSPTTAPDSDALLYNLATATARAGRAADALELFDELLERDPSNADVRHNREIAARLAELDEAEAGEEGEPGGESEGEDETGEQQGEQPGDQQGDQQGEGADGEDGSSDKPSGDEGAEGADGDTSDAPEADADAREERQAEAEAALEAEREAEQLAEELAEREAAAEDGEVSEGEESEDAVGEEARTLSEREQAIEQRLRSIDDDPSGLLRRRLEWNHRNEYPEVRDGVQPW